MEKLDQLIEKFKEVKEELQKSTDAEKDELNKAFISFFSKWGPAKKVKPVVKPEKKTGIDKIKEVSKEPITPTVVQEDRKRAAAMGVPSNPTNPNKPAKLTGLDRIKAESQKPITATTVKKSDEEDMGKSALLPRDRLNVPAPRSSGTSSTAMAPGASRELTSPHDMSRANAYASAMRGEFQPKPAAVKPAATAAKPAKLTGLDRIKAAGAEPLKRTEDTLKQKTADKKHVNAGFSKTVNGSYAPQADLAMSCGEKLSLNKGGQWDLKKRLDDDDKTAASPVQLNAQGKAALSAPKEWSPGQEIVSDKMHALGRGSPTQGVASAVEGAPGSLTREKYTAASLAQRAASPDVAANVLNQLAPGFKAVSPTTTLPQLKPAGQQQPNWQTAALTPTSSAASAVMPQSPTRETRPDRPVTPTVPAVKPTGLDRIAQVAKQPIVPTTVKKDEDDGRNDKPECEKCHAKRCQCNNTGILIDKVDGGDMSVGGGV
jgi:hypothetical protein